MARPKARIVRCPGEEGYENHYRQDFCTLCAPFWMDIPICPTHNTKLSKAGFCKACRRFYGISKVA